MNSSPRPVWAKLAGLAALAVVCAAALSAGTFFGWIGRSPIMTKAVVTEAKRAVGIVPADPFAGYDHLTVLVLGCDVDYSRGGKKILKSKARSDMMLVARLDFARGTISGVSIPRDTLVAAGKYGEQKINAYHAYGGAPLAEEAVETLLPGVRVDRVVVLDFVAFQEMVDVVGGVELDVKKRMRWRDRAAKLEIDLKPGVQKLDGTDAMGFVRFRHTDSDQHRIERQKQFLVAFKDAVLAQPLRLPEVANKGEAVLGGSLSHDEVIALAKFAQKVGNDQIKLGVLPTVDAGSYNLRVDREKLEPTLQEHRLTDGPTRLTLYP